MLSSKHLSQICLISEKTSAQCRYLAQDDSDVSKYYCTKKTFHAKQIDEECQSYISECARKGINPYDQNLPLGDNCQGYLYLRYKEQGFDKDK